MDLFLGRDESSGKHIYMWHLDPVRGELQPHQAGVLRLKQSPGFSGDFSFLALLKHLLEIFLKTYSRLLKILDLERFMKKNVFCRLGHGINS